jgi:CDP-glycerol glycerophosphotransferase
LPLVTVVLAVHGRQAWIETTARSVLDGGDVELVAVDDASSDHGPEILDALASEDERVTVVQLAEPGEARSAGLDAAAGDYVWFLEPGDELAPGALARISERLRETAPDVLLVEQAAADLLGRTRRRRLPALPATATLDQRPAIAATAAGGVRDKLLRRDHLRALDVDVDGHELAVAWPALLAAERIAAAPGRAVVHRPDLATGSPVDVFAAYDAVFAFMAAHDVPAARRELVLGAMLRHQFALLEQVADPREFFRRIADGFGRHRTGAEPLPGGRIWQARLALLERGGYRGHELLEQSRRARTAAARLRGRWTERAREASLERYYRSRLAQPLDPQLAVYGAYWFRGYACNPRAIYEKARELVPEVHGVWAVRADAAASMPDGVDHVVVGSREYYDAIARAGFLINNVNFPDHLVLREGSVHLQTHHGTPLKRMGLDLRGTVVAGRRMDFDGLLRRIGRWNYSISQNAFSTLIWERVYPGRYETLEVGYPRNDVLANATADDVRRIRDELGIEPGRTAVLYAPTHREYLDDYVPVVDLKALTEALGPDHVVLVRLHYFYDSDPLLRELHRAGRIRDVASHPSIEELCLAADVLLTDYSSLMFDYAVLDRPIVIHAPDWEIYRTMRGTYFDLLAEPPGTVTRTEAELIDAIASRAAWDAEPARRRAAFRERFCSLDDGGAAERVVRRLWPSAR